MGNIGCLDKIISYSPTIFKTFFSFSNPLNYQPESTIENGDSGTTKDNTPYYHGDGSTTFPLKGAFLLIIIFSGVIAGLIIFSAPLEVDIPVKITIESNYTPYNLTVYDDELNLVKSTEVFDMKYSFYLPEGEYSCRGERPNEDGGFTGYNFIINTSQNTYVEIWL